jgi:hypothetical protein
MSIFPDEVIDAKAFTERYTIVNVQPNGNGQPFIVAYENETGKKLAMNSVSSVGDAAGYPDLREIGTTGTTLYYNVVREEYNPELRGAAGLRLYDKMRRSDGQVAAVLRLLKTPILAARWYVEPVSEGKRDQEIADMVSMALSRYQTITWPQILTECLLHLDFGYYMFEKIWQILDIGKARPVTCWQKLAPRHPLDVQQWRFDSAGGPSSVFMYAPEDQPWTVEIPIEKLLVFSNNKEAGNIEGISALRPIYKHWYFKDNMYKIDAIAMERHGIGIPMIKLPPNFSPNDRMLADQIGRNLRVNESAHIVLPPNWEILMLKLEGTLPNVMTSIEHHDEEIAKTVVAKFMQDPNPSRGIDSEQNMFMKAARYIAEQIRVPINTYAIKELVDYNYNVSDEAYPELRSRRIGDNVDFQKFSFAVRNLVGAGVLTPDAELESWVRDEMDLPKHEPSSARIMPTPQMPQPASGLGLAPGAAQTPASAGVPNVPNSGVAGPPKQATAKNSGQGTGSSSTGGPSGNPNQ